MFGWVIWMIVCIYTLVWTLFFIKDLAKGSFNIISPAYKHGRAVMELVVLLEIYVSLILTFMNILPKIHLLWLVPLSLLTGIIIGCSIVRIITVIGDCRKV